MNLFKRLLSIFTALTMIVLLIDNGETIKASSLIPNASGGFIAPIQAPSPNAVGIGTADELRNFLLKSELEYDVMVEGYLTNDIDLANYNGGNWEPIEFIFNAVIDGQGHKITNINLIDGASTMSLGFFQEASDLTIKNLGFEFKGFNFNNTKYNLGIGSLIGIIDSFEKGDVVIENCYVTGADIVGGSSNSSLGGLIGQIRNANNVTIKNSYSTLNVTSNYSNPNGKSGVGGLIGDSLQSGVQVNIINSFSTGNVTGTVANIGSGGLLGASRYSSVYSYANKINIVNSRYSGNVTSKGAAGGLVGIVSDLTISKSYSTGKVSGTPCGGLAGDIYAEPARINISDSYSVSDLTYTASNFMAGGLFGGHVNFISNSNFVLSNSYFAGTVADGHSAGSGGLMSAISSNNNTVSVTNCYFDKDKSKLTNGVLQGVTDVALNSAKTTVEMKSSETFSSWDFMNTWYMNGDYPALRAAETPKMKYDLTLEADSLKGSITKGTMGNYEAGETISLEATPKAGYIFSNWTSSNGGTFDNSLNASAVFTMPNNNTKVTANFLPVYTLTLVSDPSKGTITGTGGACREGQLITLTASPLPGYSFVNWTSSNGGTFSNSTSVVTTFSMPSNHTTITANYVLSSFTLNLEVDNSKGSIITGTNGNYAAGTLISLVATPKPGYKFLNWSSLNGVVFRDANNPVTDFTMPSNEVTVTANFGHETPLDNNFILQTDGNGVITLGQSGNYTSGAAIVISAVPGSGYAFSNWISSNGGTFSDANSSTTTFYMPNGQTTVTANFLQELFGLTLYTDTNKGTITLASNGSYAAGALITLAATPKEGFIFSGWTSSNGGVFVDSANPTTTFTMPKSPTTITANFVSSTHSLIIESDSTKGSITAGANGNYSENTVINLQASPNYGYIFSHWSSNAGTFSDINSQSTTFTMPNVNVTIIANFIPAISDLTLDVDLSKGRVLTGATGSYGHGASIELEVEPLPGYNFLNWSSSNGGSFTEISNPKTSFTMPPNSTTVVANFVPVLNMLYVTADSLQGDIVRGTTGYYQAGTTIELKAVPKPYFSFVGWTSSNGGSFADAGNPETTFITPDCYTMVLANFTPNSGVLTLEADASMGSIITGTDGYYGFGQVISLEAAPLPGYRFVNWSTSNGGTFEDIDNKQTQFTMPSGNTTVTANFQNLATQSHRLTIENRENGTVTSGASGEYISGTDILLEAEASPGYRFKMWNSSNGGTFLNPFAQSTSFKMPSNDTTIWPTFERISDGNAFISPISEREIGSIPISNVTELRNIQAGKSYYLTQDIDLSSFNGGVWIPLEIRGTGSLKTVIDGQGHKIYNLNIPQSANVSYAALIESVNSVEVHYKNLGLEVKPDGIVYGLHSAGGFFSSYYSVRDPGYIVENCYFLGDVFANNYAGSIVGYAFPYASIVDTYAVGNVTSRKNAGGLIGGGFSNCIANFSYFRGNVSSEENAGGIIGGEYNNLLITNSFATGSVTGNYAGGLAGNGYWFDLKNSYATNTVTGTNTGGILGGCMNPAGLTASNVTTVMTNIYFDKELSGQGYAFAYDKSFAPNSAKTTAQMKNPQTYYGWDFYNTWRLDNQVNAGYPNILRTQLTRYDLVFSSTPGGRTVYFAMKLKSGEVIDISAITYPGYKFVGWTSNGGFIYDPASPFTQFVMSAANTNLKANFEPIQASQGSNQSTPDTLSNHTDSVTYNSATGNISNAPVPSASPASPLLINGSPVETKIDQKTATVVFTADNSLTEVSAVINPMELVDKGLKIVTSYGTISFSSELLRSLAAQGIQNFEVVLRKGSFIIEMTADGKSLTDFTFPNSMLITIPIDLTNDKKPEKYVAVKKESEMKILPYSIAKNSDMNLYIDSLGKYDVYYNDKNFSDILDDFWAKDAIDFMSSREIFSGMGDNLFQPNTSMTRAMFVSVLGRLQGVDTSQYSSRFTDVEKGSWYEGYVAWAESNGIVSGIGNALFAPNSPITREQMAVILNNFINHANLSIPSDKTILQFNDKDNISEWATDAVRSCQMMGILSGKPGSIFDPKSESTRVEVSIVLQKIIKGIF